MTQAQIDNGVPKGFGKTSGSAVRCASAGAGRAREKRGSTVVVPEVRLHDTAGTSDKRRGTSQSRGQQRSHRRPATADAKLSSHPSGRGRAAGDKRPVHGSSSTFARSGRGATYVRHSMTAEGAAIYDDFVRLLSCFDKVSTLILVVVRGATASELIYTCTRVRTAERDARFG